MRFFKFAYFVSAFVIFILNVNNRPIPNGELKARFTNTSDTKIIQSYSPEFFIPFDIENCETLEDDNESETEFKSISAAYFSPTHFVFTGHRYIPKIVVERIPSFCLFYQSGQSFLQVFRI